MVAVEENTMRIIHKVEYDPEANRCVGFVLPQTASVHPQIEAFQAVSLKTIEYIFQRASIAKYA